MSLIPQIERLALTSLHFPSKATIPTLIYGTAWKKENTADLVYQALTNNFRGIDTACQPRHYREDLVGVGLRKALSEGNINRSDLYIQTKFTSVLGQDPNNIPYDAKSSIAEQVRVSVETSLHHLSTTPSREGTAIQGDETYLDALVMHSPLQNIDETMEAWRTLETYVPNQIRNLGISNCDLFTLMDIYERASIKPAVVQNRFYPRTKFDIGMRKFCMDKGIVYQCFWTLTANPELVDSRLVGEFSKQLGVSPQAAFYSLVLGLGNMVILNGTTKVKNMQDDHQCLATVSAYIKENSKEWERIKLAFRQLIGESTT